MKKFGFGKKSAGDNRSSKNEFSAQSSNPYAQPQQAADPYAQDTNKYAGMPPTPYQQAKAAAYGNFGNGPASNRLSERRGGYDTPPSDYRSAPEPPLGGYGTPSASQYGGGNTYGADRYGSGGGYGSNRYDNSGGYGSGSYGGDYAAAPARGPGGYGGLGRMNSNETMSTEEKRNELFGGARERFAQKASQDQPVPGDPQQSGYEADAPDAGGYGAYGVDRQLTAEEEEEEDVLATKQQIRFIKQQDVSSTQNALRIAAQAEETGRATLARLGAQGDRIHNTEKNLDLAAHHNRVAEEKARELRTLNKSMFAVHVSNPFTASSRRAERDQEIMDKHQFEREQREATRRAAFGTQQRMEGAFRGLQPGDAGYRAPQTKASLAERSKYQFEADSEDDEMENEIDSNLDALSGAAGRLNLLARATGREVDEQNKHIDRIIQKTDRVDDQVAMNRARLDRIH